MEEIGIGKAPASNHAAQERRSLRLTDELA
jgi:hypothetical protein